MAFVAEIDDGEIFCCDDGPGHGGNEAGDAKKTVHSCNYLLRKIMGEGKIGESPLYTDSASRPPRTELRYSQRGTAKRSSKSFRLMRRKDHYARVRRTRCG